MKKGVSRLGPFLFLFIVVYLSSISLSGNLAQAQWENLFGDIQKRLSEEPEVFQGSESGVPSPGGGPQNNQDDLAAPEAVCQETMFKNRDAVICDFTINHIQKVVYQFSRPWGDEGGTPLYVHQFSVESAGYNLAIDWFGDGTEQLFRQNKFAIESCRQLAQSAKSMSKGLRIRLVFDGRNAVTDKIEQEKRAAFTLLGSTVKDLLCEI